MLFTIDVGNTNIVFSIYQAKNLIGDFRLRTDGTMTRDEFGLAMVNFCRHVGMDSTDVEDIVVSSVAPQVMHALSDACVRYFGKPPLIVGEALQVDLDYAPMITERLGADRAVACIAALEKYGAPLIVADFGTATTLDALSADGVYLGGTIGTGLRVMMDALTAHASLLPAVDLSVPPAVIGTNTVMQMQAGVVSGYIGSIEYLIQKMRAEMQEPNARVVATGGLAYKIAEHTNLIDILDSQLITDGLLLLYDRYKG